MRMSCTANAIRLWIWYDMVMVQFFSDSCFTFTFTVLYRCSWTSGGIWKHLRSLCFTRSRVPGHRTTLLHCLIHLKAENHRNPLKLFARWPRLIWKIFRIFGFDPFQSASVSDLKASKWTFGYVWMNSDKKDVEDSPTAPFLIMSPPRFTFCWFCCLWFYPKPKPLARANANDWFSFWIFGRMARLKAVWPKVIFQE